MDRSKLQGCQDNKTVMGDFGSYSGICLLWHVSVISFHELFLVLFIQTFGKSHMYLFLGCLEIVSNVACSSHEIKKLMIGMLQNMKYIFSVGNGARMN